jgi:hypothetical protein
VSEWVLINSNWKKIQLYDGENNLHFWWNDDDDVRIVLDQHA